MRVLLDECVPRALRRALRRHGVRTTQEMGWAGTRDRTLLTLAIGRFDVIVTADARLVAEHGAAANSFAIIVLVGSRVPRPALTDAFTRIAAAVDVAIPGNVVEVRTEDGEGSA